MCPDFKKFPIFYGWFVVGASFLINVLANGGIMLGFTAFFEPIAHEFGWSYAQVSVAASLRGFEMGIMAPFAGLAVERFGPRKLIFAGAIVLGLGLMLLSQVNSLVMYYVAFIFVALGVSVCSGVVTMTAISHWFHHKASLAIGISTSGTALGGLLISPVTVLIDALGWRMAFFYLGIGVGGMILLLSLLLRNYPEQYGYLPDGLKASMTNLERTAAPVQVHEVTQKIKTRQILTSRAFWHIAVTYAGFFMVIASVLTHIMPYLSAVGIGRIESSLLSSAVPIVTIFGRLGFGWLGDRYNKRYVSIAAFCLFASGMLMFTGIAGGGMAFAVPFVVLFSTGWGGSAIMMPVMTKEYFGRHNFGTVLGFVMGVSAVGQMLGAPIAGWTFDTMGRYQNAWIGFAIVLFLITFVVANIPPTKWSENSEA
jgi:sugar phosphate permease